MTAESPRGQASPGPAAQGDGLPSVPLPLDQAFDASSLFQLRAAVAAHASAAGLGPSPASPSTRPSRPGRPVTKRHPRTGRGVDGRARPGGGACVTRAKLAASRRAGLNVSGPNVL